ncbi:MAG: 2-C-methyl-D-erythritol 4-phosphate cytidylyltransferase, partial [Prevotella sp.]
RNMSDEKLEKISGSTEIAQMTGMDIHLIQGDSMNFKITTPDDLSTFETIVRDRNMKENR